MFAATALFSICASHIHTSFLTHTDSCPRRRPHPPPSSRQSAEPSLAVRVQQGPRLPESAAVRAASAGGVVRSLEGVESELWVIAVHSLEFSELARVVCERMLLAVKLILQAAVGVDWVTLPLLTQSAPDFTPHRSLDSCCLLGLLDSIELTCDPASTTRSVDGSRSLSCRGKHPRSRHSRARGAARAD